MRIHTTVVGEDMAAVGTEADITMVAADITTAADTTTTAGMGDGEVGEAR
jgi:hypothetical protein